MESSPGRSMTIARRSSSRRFHAGVSSGTFNPITDGSEGSLKYSATTSASSRDSSMSVTVDPRVANTSVSSRATIFSDTPRSVTLVRARATRLNRSRFARRNCSSSSGMGSRNGDTVPIGVRRLSNRGNVNAHKHHE
jgi:hypothetical protein